MQLDEAVFISGSTNGPTEEVAQIDGRHVVLQHFKVL